MQNTRVHSHLKALAAQQKKKRKKKKEEKKRRGRRRIAPCTTAESIFRLRKTQV